MRSHECVAGADPGCPSAKAEPLGLTPLELGRTSWLNDLTHARCTPSPSLAREGDPEIPGPGSTTLAPASSEGGNRWGGAAGTACPSPAQASDGPQGARMQCTGNRVELQLLLDGERHQWRGGRAAPCTMGGMWQGALGCCLLPLMNDRTVNQSSQFGTLLPGNIWLCLGTFLVVTARGGAAGTQRVEAREAI